MGAGSGCSGIGFEGLTDGGSTTSSIFGGSKLGEFSSTLIESPRSIGSFSIVGGGLADILNNAHARPLNKMATNKKNSHNRLLFFCIITQLYQQSGLP